MDTDGVAMTLHCSHRTQAGIGKDKCSQDVIPAKAMKLSAEDVKAYNEIIALDPGRKTIAKICNPTAGAFLLEREKSYEFA